MGGFSQFGGGHSRRKSEINSVEVVNSNITNEKPYLLEKEMMRTFGREDFAYNPQNTSSANHRSSKSFHMSEKTIANDP